MKYILFILIINTLLLIQTVFSQYNYDRHIDEDYDPYNAVNYELDDRDYRPPRDYRTFRDYRTPRLGPLRYFAGSNLVANGKTNSTDHIDSKTCGKFEKFKKCGCHCSEMCDNRNKPGVCPKDTNEYGCFCIKGFFRTQTGECVPEDHCDEPLARPNQHQSKKQKPCGSFEKYLHCGYKCSESLENYKNPTACPHSTDCSNGCFCIDGFYRNKKGECEPPPLGHGKDKLDTNHKCSDKREKFDDCGSKCRESCDFIENPTLCIEFTPDKCFVGCVCKQDHFRNAKGICVPESECPTEDWPGQKKLGHPAKCKANEEFNKCGNKCLKSCDTIDSPAICKSSMANQCDQGCFCKEGFYRNKRAVCVPKHQCDHDAELTIPTSSSQGPPRISHDTSHTKFPNFPKFPDFPKIPSMKEADNDDEVESPSTRAIKHPTLPKFPKSPEEPTMQIENNDEENEPRVRRTRRNNPENNEPDQDDELASKPSNSVVEGGPDSDRTREPNVNINRPYTCIREHEMYQQCGDRCLESLESATNPMFCPKQSKCIAGCFCIDGYNRNSTGVCVVPPANANANAPVMRRQQMIAEKENNGINCPINQEYRVHYGCVCVRGYIKNNYGICVMSIATTTNCLTPTCPENEHYSECGNKCMESLENIDDQSVCDRNFCNIGCFCDEGLLRDSEGVCVPPPPKTECVTTTTPCAPTPEPCPENESMTECGNRCLESIENIDNPSVCDPNVCQSGCFCENGLKRNREGVCVRPPPKCPQYETYSDCGNRCMESINFFYESIPCNRYKCNVGCFCISGRFRNREGRCVVPPPPTTTACAKPPPTCAQNEIYSECGNRCMESLENIDDQSVCDRNFCSIGCFCEPGLFRDSEGACVPPPPKCVTTTTPCAPTPEPCSENESMTECGNRCLESIENIDNPSVCDPNVCQSGCFCENGLKRNTKGVCVRPPPKCPLYETFSDCGNRCMESIENFYHSTACNAVACSVGCFCIPGRFRDMNGKCVIPPPPTTTACAKPTEPPCPENEERIDECGNRCLESIESITNPSLCRRRCDSGCFCVDSYFRDNTGICVIPPKLQCTTPPPPTCREDEVYSECGNRCMESLDNIYDQSVCDRNHCSIGCFCEPGLFRNSRGICVPPPPPTTTTTPCPAYEAMSNCGNRCLESIENIIDPSVCRRQCQTGCFCIDNYFRDNSGLCTIPPKVKCTTPAPPTCPEFEAFSECGNRCMESLDNRLFKRVVCEPNHCDVGCFCLPELFRNKNGFCVKPPPPCGPREVYVECGNRCMESLHEFLSETHCNPNLCSTGCFCRKGYYRADTGRCVVPPPPTTTTPCPQCPNNEEWSECGNRCLESIESLENPSACPRNAPCTPGCYCLIGQFRDSEGACVDPPPPTTTHCPAPTRPQCPAGEEYRQCSSRCAESCANCDDPSLCSELEPCHPGCFCIEGEYRNKRGLCVPRTSCEANGLRPLTPKPKQHITCGSNEEYDSCGTHCGQHCPNLEPKYENSEECTNPKCAADCFCIQGYYRNEHNLCVQIKDCDSAKEHRSCGKNEEYSDCGNECGKTCADFGSNKMCSHQCKQGCFCRKDYLRDIDFKCVRPNKCQNRYIDKPEPIEVETERQVYTTRKRRHRTSAKPGVDEEPEKIVTIRPTFKCGRNEHWSECGSVCGQSCKLFSNSSNEQSCPPECTPGCFCNENLYRNEENACVPQEQCVCKLRPQECKDDNEEYFWCYNECGRTCRDYKQGPTAKCKDMCSRGCFCNDGLIRNEDGICVRPEVCNLSKNKIRCKPNEAYYDCGSECGHRCSDINISVNELKCYQCTGGCYCAKGLYRTESGECVPKNKCFETNSLSLHQTKCEENEVYMTCGNLCTESCENAKRVDSVENCPLTCEKGCICRKGYKRNKAGICVLENRCNDKPECKGPNERYSDCGTDCGHRCNDLIKANLQCPLSCGIGCFCQDDYYRDQNGVCIPQEKCVPDPIECPDNEIYRKCGQHCGESCEDLLNPVDCPKKCEADCFCQKDLYRGNDGICVNKTACNLPTSLLPKHTCAHNEEYKCSDKCSESCEDRTDCKNKCINGCYCVDGHLRHQSGQCVPDDQCKQMSQCMQCQQNEYFSNCGTDCGNYCSDLTTNIIDKCDKDACFIGCYCKYGFRRNELGKCVTQDNCFKR